MTEDRCRFRPSRAGEGRSGVQALQTIKGFVHFVPKCVHSDNSTQKPSNLSRNAEGKKPVAWTRTAISIGVSHENGWRMPESRARPQYSRISRTDDAGFGC